MRAVFAIFGSVCALSLPFAGAIANETEVERISYSTRWIAWQPLLELEGEPLPAIGEKRTVARGDIVLASQLFPEQLASPNEEILDEKGKSIASAGQEFFSLSSSSGRIFCSSKFKEQSAVVKLLVGGGESNHICLVDEDSDGDFDFYFKALSEIKGLPSLSGRTSKRPKRIAETSYTTTAGAEMEGFLFVALEYRGNANIYSQHVFETIFGSADKQENITSRISVKQGDVPKAVNFLGGQFRLLSGDNSVAEVQVERSIRRVPFGVSRTVEYLFY